MTHPNSKIKGFRLSLIQYKTFFFLASFFFVLFLVFGLAKNISIKEKIAFNLTSILSVEIRAWDHILGLELSPRTFNDPRMNK